MTVETELVILASLFIDVSNRSIRASMCTQTRFGKECVSVLATATALVKFEVSPFMLVVTLFRNEAKAVLASDTATVRGSESASKSTRVRSCRCTKLSISLLGLPHSGLKACDLCVNFHRLMIIHPAHHIIHTIHAASKSSCLRFNYRCQSFDHSLTPFLVRILQSGCGLHH